jgi:thiol:disulfide interchange protein DsbC
MITVATTWATDQPIDRKTQIDAALRAQISSRLPGAKPDEVEFLPDIGLYEVRLGGRTVYVTADGKHLITGELIDIATKENISDNRRAARTVGELDGIKEQDLIIFEPIGLVKHTITVFIDPDCTYCRKLHSQIKELNQLGVRVRYAAYPRSGPRTESWVKTESVWCSSDRRQALTQAMLDKGIQESKCSTPVAGQYEFGKRVGVLGTPAILNEDAKLINGYLPPDQLVAKLDSLRGTRQK